jgi:predicted RNase H-like HicB family nuclease
MQCQILVKQQPDNSFLATALGIPECRVEAQTKEQAVIKAKEAIESLLSQGEIVVVEVDSVSSNPWLKLHGQLKDEPMFDDVIAEIKAYRDSVDEQEAK